MPLSLAVNTCLAIALAILASLASLGSRPAAAANARTSCGELARLPLVESESARWAREIWLAVARAEPDAAPPKLSIVDHPVPGAWLCPASDKVYLSIRMAEYAHLGRHGDGADLLGFVFAHELAHRRFDPGEHSFAGRCPDVDPALEALADHRATLLLARATNPFTGRGFSPFQLARRDTLRAFFAAELGWAPDCPALSARVDAAHAAIGRLGELATAYRAALVVSASGHPLALDLLAALSPRHGAWDAVPELALVEAAVHLARASPRGPCPATLPRWTRVAPLDLHGGRSGLADPLGPGGPLALSRAREALTRASSQRVPEAQRLGLELCHAHLSDLANGPPAGSESPGPTRAPGPTGPLIARLEALGRREEADRIAAWASPTSVPAPPRPMSTSSTPPPIDPETLAIPPCGEALTRFAVGRLTLTRLGECLELSGASRLRLEPVALRDDQRPLARWAAACGTPHHTTEDGTSWWGSGCSRSPRPERWVLEVRGARVERAWLVTSLEPGQSPKH